MRLSEVIAPEDYRGEHEAAGPDDGSPLWDVTRNGTYPNDFYTSPTHRYYGDGNPATDLAITQVLRLHNRPNTLVTIYRAIPKSAPRGTKINIGDWVTTVRRYALEHGRANLRNQFRIIELIAHARDLFTAGDSLAEWGYHPQPEVPRTPEQQARRQAAIERFRTQHQNQPLAPTNVSPAGQDQTQ